MAQDTSAELKGINGLVRGRVQGVGFRWYVQRTARSFGVDGNVKNLADGRVEFNALGSPEKIERLVRAIRQGPPGSRVDSVVTRPLQDGAAFTGFEINH